MSNNDEAEPEKKYRDWNLWWGGLWDLSGKKHRNKQLPLFQPYYSYLLKLSKGVGLVDIYPWLAELMFFSVAVEAGKSGEESQNFDLKANTAALNMVTIFVDDSGDNVAMSRLNQKLRLQSSPIEEMLEPKAGGFPLKSEESPRCFLVDTFGRFINMDSANLLKWKDGCYATSCLVGAGNPMQMMRRFTTVGNLQCKWADRNAPTPEGTKQNHIFPEQDLGKLNCFVINSISSLYRSMGVRDAMLLVRTLLEKGVWKPENELPDVDKKVLIDHKGLLFAIVHEGVFPEQDSKYIETFFDGVIVFEKNLVETNQTTNFHFERFPPAVLGRSESPSSFPPFQPDFLASYTFAGQIDGTLTVTF